MIVLHDGDVSPNRERPSAVAIGVFDGLHLGHQKIIARVLDVANREGAVPTVVTFDPHPAWVLAPDSAPLLLGTMAQRLEGLARLGIEQVRVLHFDQVLASEHAVAFIDRVLVGELHAIQVVVGRDFRFGHEREGDVETLEREGLRRGFEVFSSPIHGAAQRWSSTSVRDALRDGDLELANATLGRPFTLRGTVEHGDARGGELGYPTANLALAARQQIPQRGIYAGAVRLENDQWWPAAISVGTRPQFYDDGVLLIEVHVPRYAGDLYEKTLDVSFLRRLRGEMTFDGVDLLVAQIERDVKQTVEIFEKFTPHDFALLE